MVNLDPSARYALSNPLLGGSRVLSSTRDNATLHIENFSDSDNQLWYVTKTHDTSTFRLHTVQKGDNFALDVFNYSGSEPITVHFQGTGEKSGQYWRFEKWYDGSLKISNNFTGSNIHLEVPEDTLAPKLAGGDNPGQHWTLSKLGSNLASTSIAEPSKSSQSSIDTPELELQTSVSLATASTATDTWSAETLIGLLGIFVIIFMLPLLRFASNFRKRKIEIRVPQFLSKTSTAIKPWDNGRDAHRFDAVIYSKERLALFLKSGRNNATGISSTADISAIPLRPESLCYTSTEDINEEEYRPLGEFNEDSNEASGECDVGVNSALQTAMGVVKGLLLRELVAYALLEARCNLERPGESTAGSNSGSGGSYTSSNIHSPSSKSHAPRRRKRTRVSESDPGDQNDEGTDDEDDQPRKKNERDSLGRLPHRRLKCPFYQHQPEKYKKAACRGEGFADMAKLKDHIKRVHTQPIRCCRCWLEMKSEDAYNDHLQQEGICKKSSEPQEDRISQQFLRQLDFKKAPYSNARNIEEKWTLLFSALFPKEPTIPSPYEQQGISPRLEWALSKALEEELIRELEPILGPIISRIKAIVPAIIQSCRMNLMHASQPANIEELLPLAVSLGTGGDNSESRSTGHPGISRERPFSCYIAPE